MRCVKAYEITHLYTRVDHCYGTHVDYLFHEPFYGPEDLLRILNQTEAWEIQILNTDIAAVVIYFVFIMYELVVINLFLLEKPKPSYTRYAEFDENDNYVEELPGSPKAGLAPSSDASYSQRSFRDI